jgi:hypothetical protein
MPTRYGGIKAHLHEETHHLECTGCGQPCEAERRHGWRSKCCGQYVAVVKNPSPMSEG